MAKAKKITAKIRNDDKKAKINRNETGNATVDATREAKAGGNAIGKYVYITLDSFAIKRLISKDKLGDENNIEEREGVLNFEINGQGSSIGWATNKDGSLKNESKYKKYLVYVGENKKYLDASIKLIEIDKDDFNLFKRRVESVVGFIQAGSAFVPTYGPLISATAGLFNAIVNVAGTYVDDDTELSFYGSLADIRTPNKESEISISRRQDNGDLDYELQLSTNDIKLSSDDPNNYPKISLFIESIENTIDFSGIKRDIFSFESEFGSGKKKQEFSFTEKNEKNVRLKSIFTVRDKLVYEGAWIGFLPYALNLTAYSEDRNEEQNKAIEELLTNIKGVSTEVIKLDAVELELEKRKVENDVPGFLAKIKDLGKNRRDISSVQDEINELVEAFEAISSIRKAGQTFQNVISQFRPKKTLIGNISGLLVAGDVTAQNGTDYICDVNLKDNEASFPIAVPYGPGQSIVLNMKMIKH